MIIRLKKLTVVARESTEVVEFSKSVTFLHGPVSTGKSTTVRLIDYCLGGGLDNTPAIQSQFVAAILSATLGENEVELERAAGNAGTVRVTWVKNPPEDAPANSRTADESQDTDQQADVPDAEAVTAPLDAGPNAIVGSEIYNLSDLIFWLCGVEPIKVRRSKLDPDSALVRLSFRDLYWYCYLEQRHIDSSFFCMEHPFKRLKSRDAMRFVTGFHSERLSQIEVDLAQAQLSQRAKREAVDQIREFMSRFNLGTESGIEDQLRDVGQLLAQAVAQRNELDRTKAAQTHPSEALRETLRSMSADIEATTVAISDVDEQIAQQEGLRSELITAKVKAARVEQATRVLGGAVFTTCPRCGSDVSGRECPEDHCVLCGSTADLQASPPEHLEALRRDLNERIDELADSISRKKRARDRLRRELAQAQASKREADQQLSRDLATYDSTFVATARKADSQVAQLTERLRSVERLKEMPDALRRLEVEAGAIQGEIDALRSALVEERSRLTRANMRIQKIASRFLDFMVVVGFPGVYESDKVVLSPQSWSPIVVHGDQQWGFDDVGSGGKSTLFNICYALAVHTVAVEERLPLPPLLVIDGPTKNISEDVNPEIVGALYKLIYDLAAGGGAAIQFVLVDSELAEPEPPIDGFMHRRMAGEEGAPRLISYYEGP